MTVHTYVCTDCRHRAHLHRLAEGGDLRAGPYVCPCGCSQPQNGAFVGIDRRANDAWDSANPPPAVIEPDEVPPDVKEWVEDTYDEEGQAIWLRAYEQSDGPHRRRMISIARTPEMGT